ncbi:hypothetical protein GY45DRAFT_1364113 [Cubamyces sp. BRFM 1775]|nr:hypothetical protein GY45DRAFT_1364113 [Cubamyces sp. BRFM 1775]
MLSAYIRAFIASFLSLLLANLDKLSLTDWTRSLPCAQILHQLPPGPSDNNATSIDDLFLDAPLYFEGNGHANHSVTPLSTIHPAFEATATIVSHIRVKLTSSSLPISLFDILVWLFMTVFIGLPLLVSLFEYCLSALYYVRDLWPTTCPSSASHQPVPHSSCTWKPSPSPLLQAVPESSEASSPATTSEAIPDNPVCLPAAREDSLATSGSICEFIGSLHTRLLTDVVAQNEAEGCGVKKQSGSADGAESKAGSLTKTLDGAPAAPEDIERAPIAQPGFSELNARESASLKPESLVPAAPETAASLDRELALSPEVSLPEIPAESTSMVRAERLGSVTRDAVALFSESRISQNLIDGRENQPLTSGVQVMRPLLEVGRSRCGTGTVATPLVALERCTTHHQVLDHTHNEPLSVASGWGGGSVYSQTVRPSPAQVFHGTPVLGQTPPAGASPTNSASTSTEGRKRVSKSFASYLSTLIIPVPHEHAVPAAQSSDILKRQASQSPADVSENWRVRRVAEDPALNAEFAPSPTPIRPPFGRSKQQQGSLFSVTGRAQLRDLAASAQTRSDIVHEASPTARKASQGCADEDDVIVLLRGEHHQDMLSPSQRVASSASGPPRYMLGVNSSRVRKPSPLASVVSTPGDIFSCDSRSPPSASSTLMEVALQQSTASAGSGLSSGMSQSISGDLVLYPRSGPRRDIDQQTDRLVTPPSACPVVSVATSSSSCLATVQDVVVPRSSSSALVEACSGNPLASSVGEASVVSKSPGSTPPASSSHDSVQSPETKAETTATTSTLAFRTHQWQVTVWRPKSSPSSSSTVPRSLLVVSRTSDGVQRPQPLAVIATNLPESAWPRLRQSTAPAAPSGSFDSVRKRAKADKRDKERRRVQAVLEAKPSSLAITTNRAAPRSAVAFRPPGRYDPWDFEHRPSADLQMANRGHQAVPHTLSKHRRPVTAERRLRATSAYASLTNWGSGSAAGARERTITGGRFDVLDSDVILA